MPSWTRVIAPDVEELPVFAHAAIAGDQIYVSGMLGLTDDFKGVVEGGIGPETKQAFRHTEKILAACGAARRHRQGQRVPAGPRRVAGHEHGVPRGVRGADAGADRDRLRRPPARARVEFDCVAYKTLMIRLLVAALIGLGVAAPAAAARDVLYVGNNWDGTADVVDPKTFKRAGADQHRPRQGRADGRDPGRPRPPATSSRIRQLVGEGHDQFVDDMFTSHDGRFLYVSRPSFADVVAFDLRTRKIVWRVPVEGYRADHMAISPDGTRLAVSASTARKVHMIDTATGQIVGSFESGDQPHENNYSADGTKIFHAVDRLGLHARRRPGARRHQGRPLVRDRRRAQPARCSSASTWARSSRRPATRT